MFKMNLCVLFQKGEIQSPGKQGSGLKTFRSIQSTNRNPTQVAAAWGF
jgi:hypothetical protein